MDYNKYHVDVASRYSNFQDKKVLVVGCNRGKEVDYFVELGVREVWGIDLIDEIGEDFSHKKAQYFKMSAEAMEFPNSSFDFVFCFATMEHIINIDKAFPEMVRVTKPGGIIYCVAAPLWNSRQGHHKSNVFDIDKYSWVHLRFTEAEIKNKCRTGEITYPDWVEDIDAHIEYMMNPRYFNRTPAKQYVAVCNQLDEVEIIRNSLDLEKEHYLALLTVDDFKFLLDKGFDSSELLALTHTFIGRKKQFEETSFLVEESSDIPKREALEDKENELNEKYSLLKKRLHRKRADLRRAKAKIQEMEDSKFWKLRNIWVELKKIFPSRK